MGRESALWKSYGYIHVKLAGWRVWTWCGWGIQFICIIIGACVRDNDVGN